MNPFASFRGQGAQLAVLGLGVLSALALLGVSMADFGDPRATARAQAQQLERAQVAEVRLAWDEARAGEVAPPGSTGVFRLGDQVAGDLGVVSAAADDGLAEPGPLIRAYFELGRTALERGDAAVALESFAAGIAGADAETAGYRAALFGAVRAAGALGETERLRELRAALFRLPDDVIHGTSLHFLAALVAPVDVQWAHARLMSGTALLPAPRDRAVFDGGVIALDPDPWWGAIRERLATGEGGEGLDWDAALSVTERLGIAVETELQRANIVPSERWSISRWGRGFLAARGDESGVEVTGVRLEAFREQLLVAVDSDLLRCSIGPRETSLDSATRLAGTPFSLSVQHSDPEGAAAPELRRTRVLRAALVGLALLVLLAAGLSARTMARARQLNELRSTFVASVSHDLRTPTQAILLLAQTLEQDLVDAPSGRARYHTQIRKEAQRLRRLVEDLLDGARVDRGDGARVERRDVESAGFFGELESAMEERAASAGAQLSVDVADMPEFLNVDPDGVYRAVWNLLENALRYGRRGDSAAEVRVTAEVQGENLAIVVEDQGPGVPARDAESIFRPFQRLDGRGPKSDRPADIGTGLGLPIVRAICRAHGGSAVLEPSAHGARFVLTLPIRNREGVTP